MYPVSTNPEAQFLSGVMMIVINLVSSPVNNGKKTSNVYSVLGNEICKSAITQLLCQVNILSKSIVAQMTRCINPD